METSQDGVVHVRQTMGRVKQHGAQEAEAKTRLVFQELKTETSRCTVPLPATCLTTASRLKAALTGGV